MAHTRVFLRPAADATGAPIPIVEHDDELHAADPAHILSVNLPNMTLAAYQGSIFNATVINGTEPDASSSAGTYSREGQEPRQYLVRADGAGHYPMVPPPPPHGHPHLHPDPPCWPTCRKWISPIPGVHKADGALLCTRILILPINIPPPPPHGNKTTGQQPTVCRPVPCLSPAPCL